MFSYIGLYFPVLQISIAKYILTVGDVLLVETVIQVHSVLSMSWTKDGWTDDNVSQELGW